MLRVACRGNANVNTKLGGTFINPFAHSFDSLSTIAEYEEREKNDDTTSEEEKSIFSSLANTSIQYGACCIIDSRGYVLVVYDSMKIVDRADLSFIGDAFKWDKDIADVITPSSIKTKYATKSITFPGRVIDVYKNRNSAGETITVNNQVIKVKRAGNLSVLIKEALPDNTMLILLNKREPNVIKPSTLVKINILLNDYYEELRYYDRANKTNSERIRDNIGYNESPRLRPPTDTDKSLSQWCRDYNKMGIVGRLARLHQRTAQKSIYIFKSTDYPHFIIITTPL